MGFFRALGGPVALCSDGKEVYRGSLSDIRCWPVCSEVKVPF
jgi:hypothetical protein